MGGSEVRDGGKIGAGGGTEETARVVMGEGRGGGVCATVHISIVQLVQRCIIIKALENPNKRGSKMQFCIFFKAAVRHKTLNSHLPR